jgi:glycerol-3-phosphate dehydrogenase (NAD(P)+)
MSRITIIGGGSWGTALAVLACRQEHSVTIWSRDPLVVDGIERTRHNPKYLSTIKIPDRVAVTGNLRAAAKSAELIILACPSQVIRPLLEVISGYVEEKSIFISAAKGIEAVSCKRVSEVVGEMLGQTDDVQFACLSGPSFALEAALGHPTAVAVASSDLQVARRLQGELSTNSFRIYANSDVIGTELAGATKNVMAIAAGMVSGMGFGSNSVAALITRGLTEISRFGLACGGQLETMMGLAGLGDLVLTCTGALSRNRFVGEELGKGKALADVTAGMREVAEGIETTIAVKNLAERKGIEMPITNAVFDVLYSGVAPRTAIERLMTRPLRDE